MSARSILMAAAGSSVATAPYPDDVFNTNLFAGQTFATTITNGIDLAGKGGMVWTKSRTSANSNYINYTDSGSPTLVLRTESSAAQSNEASSISAFNSNGFTGWAGWNPQALVSWTFRKAPTFFDVVTYTGNGTTSRIISHNLGATPGMIIIKSLDVGGGGYDFWVYHRSTGFGSFTFLNAQSASTATDPAYVTAASSGSFTISRSSVTNITASKYVAFLFGHDITTNGIVQCGSFTTDASGNASITSLGWEPQFLLAKASSATSDWIMLDHMRGWNMTGSDALLRPNTDAAETKTTEYGNPTATGFEFKGGSASATYIYMAIRRPNKPPTTTNFFSKAVTIFGDSSSSTYNSYTDAFLIKMGRNDAAKNWVLVDRVRGYGTGYGAYTGQSPILFTNNTNAEVSDNTFSINDENSFWYSYNSSYPAHTYSFRRLPGFFDIVCYSGTSVARTVAHSLGVAPELIIVKCRNQAGRTWPVGAAPFFASWQQVLFLEQTAAKVTLSYWDSTAPTSSVFSLGTSPEINGSTLTYVAYLFATLPGISKVGSYTGNGTSQTINAGFTTGARFVMIKRTDSTGDWYLWDSVRGIVDANDPHLSLNSSAAEVTTDDSVDPDSTGFIVNQVAATNINVTSANYLYLAIA